MLGLTLEVAIVTQLNKRGALRHRVLQPGLLLRFAGVLILFASFFGRLQAAEGIGLSENLGAKLIVLVIKQVSGDRGAGDNPVTLLAGQFSHLTLLEHRQESSIYLLVRRSRPHMCRVIMRHKLTVRRRIRLGASPSAVLLVCNNSMSA